MYFYYNSNTVFILKLATNVIYLTNILHYNNKKSMFFLYNNIIILFITHNMHILRILKK